ncbi:MAG: sulfatase [Candidatus Fermentibacteraceae bacterium]|nr:sulfatase [Candidatus Fermentibacteraceae bacterium]MBN2607662.1 sulfatase [Candidatus Fermentibacteraceae bacterium]
MLCRAALAAIPLLLILSCGRGDVEGTPDLNVVLVIIDTLRADHIGYWGYDRGTTPCLDSLAAAGTAWMETQAQSSWTLPSVASILTGLTPREHGAGYAGGELFGLSSSIRTLQGILHSRGWRSCGIFNVIFLNEDFGFHRGFDHFDCRGITENSSTRRAGETVDTAIQWLEGLAEDDKFLLVVHFYDPHIPYDPPPPYDVMFSDEGGTGGAGYSGLVMDTILAVNRGEASLSLHGLRMMTDLYDGEVAYTDGQIGRLFNYLTETGLSDRSLVIVTADHGEEFLEHSGLEHGRTLYQEVLHVPLILSGPGVPAGAIRTEPCAQVDILPTVLSYLGLEIPAGPSGIDLLGGSGAGSRDLPSSNLMWSAPAASVRRDDRKIIWKAEDGGTEFYDLSEDPMEQHSIGVSGSAMLQAVEYYWSTPPLADPPVVSFGDAEDNQLRDLGYLR